MTARAGADRVGPAEDPWDAIAVDGPETLAERRLLASFGLRAQATNLGRVLRLVELMERSDRGLLDEAGRQEAENLAHQVVGSAGTFGQPAASLDAARVERFFAVGHASGGARSADERQPVRDTLDRLRREFGGQA